MPVKVVTVEMDGVVEEVDDTVTCSSTDEDVVKVTQGFFLFRVLRWSG